MFRPPRHRFWSLHPKSLAPRPGGLPRRGFTMTELVTVMCVIGTLGLIAVPSYLGYRTKMQDRATESVMVTLANEAQSLAEASGEEFTAELTQGAVAQLPADAKAAALGVTAASGFVPTGPGTSGTNPSVEYGTVSFGVVDGADGSGSRLHLAMRSISGNCVFGVVRLVAAPVTEIVSSDLGDGCRATNASTLEVVYEDTGAPSAPTALSCTPGDESAELSWTAPPENDIGSYLITRQGSGATTMVPAPAIKGVVEGLTNKTAYTFSVRAVDKGGQSSPSSATVSCTPIDNVLPTTPTNVTTQNGDYYVTVTWTASYDKHLDHYELYRANSNGTPNPVEPWTLIESDAARIPLTEPTVTYIDRDFAGKDAGGSVDLTPGEYFYRVVAVDTSANKSPTSTHKSGVANGLTPPAPTPSATSNQARVITLTLGDSKVTTGDFQGYRIYGCQRTNGTPCAPKVPGDLLAQTLPGVTQWEHKPLGNGQSWDYQVTAYAYAGAGCSATSCPWYLGGISAASAIVPGKTVPLPTCASFTTKATVSQQLDLSWACSDHKSVTIERKAAGALDSAYTLVTTVLAGTSSYADGGLPDGSAYDYRLTPVNDATDIGANKAVQLTTSASTLPGQPTLTVGTNEVRKVTVSWSDPAGTETGFNLYRSPAPTPGSALVKSFGPSTFSYVDDGGGAGLGNDATYSYWVEAVNDSGSPSKSQVGPSSLTKSSTTMALPSCTAVTATSYKYQSVPLGWTCTGNDQGVRIERATTAGGTRTVVKTNQAGALYADPVTKDDQDYFYWITPMNAAVDLTTAANTPKVWTASAHTMGLPTNVTNTTNCPNGQAEANAGGPTTACITTYGATDLSRTATITVSLTGPDNYSWSTAIAWGAGDSMSGTRTSTAVPLAVNDGWPQWNGGYLTATVKACNDVGCTSSSKNVEAAPQIAKASASVGACGYGHCWISMSAAKANTYEVQVVSDGIWVSGYFAWSDYNYAAGIGCETDGERCDGMARDWTVYYYPRNADGWYLRGSYSFHIYMGCYYGTGSPYWLSRTGCTRKITVPMSSHVKVGGTSFTSVTNDGWCRPGGPDIAPASSACNWSTTVDTPVYAV